MNDRIKPTLVSTIKENLYKLWSFHGGIKIAGHKFQSNQNPISIAKTAKQLIIPLTQHIGQAADLIVSIGDKVLKGQVLAHAHGVISAPIHASASGIIRAIEKRAIPHPSGLLALCVVIDTDAYQQSIEYHTLTDDINSLSAKHINQQIAQAGIVGLGGALFPSAAKLHTAQKMHVETLIINAAECEPYITCDDALMRRCPEEVILGVLLLKKVIGAKKCLIGIEDNKPEAYHALLEAISGYNMPHTEAQIEVIPIPARYPAGGEKQLIQVLTGKEVPSAGLPMDIGMICHNVTTAASVYQAVYRGEPLTSRIVTITGGAVKQPQNMEVPIGTSIRDVLMQVGLHEDKIEKVIMGGPMMGFALPSLDVPITKATNCLLVSEQYELATPPPAMPCIRCARCADSCPMSLLPQQMYWYAKARELEKAEDYNLFDCIECGCCSYECPSNIPLVQYFRYAKNEIANERIERKKADQARERHEFRQERLEKAQKAKAEAARLRKEKLAKKKALDAQKAKEAQENPDSTLDCKVDTGEDLIQEAIARAKQKKAQQQTQKKNTENLTQAQQKQIDAVNKRRSEKQSTE